MASRSMRGALFLVSFMKQRIAPMNQFPILITRNSPPSDWDHAPVGCICQVKNEYYIQVSLDEDMPSWKLHLGDYDSALRSAQQLKNPHELP